MKKNTNTISAGYLKLKDFPCDEKPIERMLKWGAEALSDAELLAIILKTGRPGEHVVDLARRVLSQSEDGSLWGLYDVSVEELKRIDGIGQSKAAQIVALCQMAVRISRDKSARKKKNISSISQLGKYLMAEMRWLRKEVFKVVMVDSRWNILNTVQISEGSLDQSIVHPREVFVAAVRNYAAAIVLVHNHPSGNPSPSKPDFETTERLIRAGEMLGIEVADHIVTGENEFYSMYLNGDMARLKRVNNSEV